MYMIGAGFCFLVLIGYPINICSVYVLEKPYPSVKGHGRHFSQDSKTKKVKPKKDKGDKKLFPSKDDEHFLLTGVTVSNRKG